MSAATEISAQIRMRNRCLILAATSFLVWQGMQLSEAYLPASPVLSGTVLAAGFLGMAGFVVSILIFLTYANRVTQARSQAVIEDERFVHNQARAVRFGYIALLGCLSALYVALDFAAIPVELAVRGLLVAGVCIPLFAFVILDGGSD